MNRLRLADVRTPIARVLGVCTDDSKVATYVNEAHARLVSKGKWVGTIQRYRICVSNACLTWPRQIETIEAFQICRSPGTVRNSWYEYVGNGPGLLKEDDGWYHQLLDRGMAVAFDDITGTDKKIQVLAAVSEDADARILLQGYDENAQWIRTQDAGSWIDGEYVSISTTAQYTTNIFSVLTGAVKPATNGPVRLFEYDTTTADLKPLAYYESDETVPLYRRSMIPGLENMSGCADGESTCSSKAVTVMAKLRHIDVVNDNDYLLLGNIGAIKLMVAAILKEERNLMDEAMIYEAKALKELQDELHSYEGDGAIPVLRTANSDIWGAGVLNVIANGYGSY